MVARRGDDCAAGVSLIPNELYLLQPKEVRGLVDDSLEDPLRRRPGGDERRDPSERSLLLAEAPYLVVRLSVRYRSGNQVGEGCQPLLGAGRERLRRLRADHHDAPQLALDNDRSRD